MVASSIARRSTPVTIGGPESLTSGRENRCRPTLPPVTCWTIAPAAAVFPPAPPPTRLIAPVQVIDILKDGRPSGAESRHDEGSAGTDIRHIDRAAVERAGSRDHCAAAFDIDVRTQLAELRHVLKTVFEDRLRDDAPTVRLRHEADEGRLQVRGEAGVRPGRHVDRLHPLTAPHPEAVRPIFHPDAPPPQLADQGPQVSRYNIFEDSLTTRRRDGDRVGPSLDVVGDDAMRRAA